MSVDPTIDYESHDPEDREELSDIPEIREMQELEARMRAALATKENPLHDDETTSERLRAAGFDDPIETEGPTDSRQEDGSAGSAPDGARP